MLVAQHAAALLTVPASGLGRLTMTVMADYGVSYLAPIVATKREQ